MATATEKKALLTLIKDYTADHNANTLSKEIGISHVGTQKMLKRLEEQGLLTSKRIGNAIVYKPKLDDYTTKFFSFLLADEARNHQRWKEEFRDLSKEDRIVMIYGSAIRDYTTAKDIDIMVVTNKREDATIKRIDSVLPKPIHAIQLTEDDLKHNIRQKQEATVDIIRTAIVLFGQDKYLEVLKDVTRF